MLDRLRRRLGSTWKATTAELEALRLVLAGDDPRYQQIIGQLERAPRVERANPSPDAFRVGPTSTFDDLSFPLEIGRLESAWVPLRDVRSGRTLEFRAVVGRHGFLRGLEGRTVDGSPWPESWQPGPAPGGRAWNVLALPSLAEQDGRARLAAWLGAALPPAARVFPPVPEAQLATLEGRVGGALPDAVRAFLRITDGLDLPTIRFHGVGDIEEVPGARLPVLVLGWDGDDQDEFLVVVPHDGVDQATYRLDVHDPEGEPRPIAPEFRSYLRDRMSKP